MHSIFFDFFKAFDQVPHKPLLQKLHAYGIRGYILQWISAFLDSRHFHVKVGSSASNAAPVRSGVPQGSVLGPLLFLVYINDLPELLQSNALLFANDLKIWTSTDKKQLQLDVNTISSWSKDWGLPLNEDKCCHISFGGESQDSFFFDKADPPTPILKKSSIKDLGIYMTSNLSFSLHHETIAKKGFAIVNMLRRAFPRQSKTDFKFLFGTYVRPALEYASQVVNPALVKDANAIEKVQRRATKIVSGLHNVQYEERLRLLNLYPLQLRRLRGDLIFIYVQFAQGKIEELFSLADKGSLRGHDYKLYKYRARTSTRLHFFSLRVVSTWNDLPNTLVSSPSKDIFKKRLDVWLGLVQPHV